MLIFLHRAIHPIKFIDMERFYGHDVTALSRSFMWFSKFIRCKFQHLVNDSFDYWKPHLEDMTECIREKIREKSNGGLDYPPGSLCVFGFIDDSTIKTT